MWGLSLQHLSVGFDVRKKKFKKNASMVYEYKERKMALDLVVLSASLTSREEASFKLKLSH